MSEEDYPNPTRPPACQPPKGAYSCTAFSSSDTKTIADEVMSTMGGRKNWDDTRYITWRFIGFRLHVWDKWTGDLRFEQGEMTVLMNIHNKEGRVFVAGEAVSDPDTVAAKLEHGYRGVEATEDGRAAEALELTFAGVGFTPQNKYAVWVDQDSHLVTQWGFYPDASDPEPRFIGPWSNWQRHGAILLSDSRGDKQHNRCRGLRRIAAFRI